MRTALRTVLLAPPSARTASSPPPMGGWGMTITIADTTHTLRLNTACTFVVDWGDGTQETLTSTPAWTYTKTYAAPGTYRLRFSIQSGTFWPYYNNVTADVAELRTLEGTGPEAWSFGPNLTLAFYGASGLTEVSGGMNTAGVTNFFRTWRRCTSLTSFPLLDVSSGTNFQDTWQQCASLTSFPLLDVSSGTKFDYAWVECTSLTSFPANFFDVTGTLTSTAFNTLGLNGGTNAGAATWTPAAIAAYDTLITRGWTISRNA
jgi:hypothetical protein